MGSLKTIILRIFQLLPIRKRAALFVSFYGNYYNDHPKAISDALKGENIKIYWLANNPNNFADAEVTFIKKRSIRAIYLLATAQVWVDNCRKSSWIRKRKNQFYVQTWHGCLGFKKAEGDAIDKLSKSYVQDAINDSRMADIMVSDSSWGTAYYRKFFWFNGEIMQVGSPRLDRLLNHDINNEDIRNRLNIHHSTHIILYAPTFRNDSGLDAYDIDYDKVVSAMEDATKEQWIFLLRFHPNIAEYANKQFDGAINVTQYPDLYELISVCDYYITDYSSALFEAATVKKPVVIYANDIDSYFDERGLAFDINDLPFDVVTNTNSLIKTIKQMDVDKYLERSDAFLSTLGVVDNGNASRLVADKIVSFIEKS